MSLQSASTILSSPKFWELENKAQKYVHHQFQDYGYRLATKLGDIPHKAIYIRMAKFEDRGLLEQALSFALDYDRELNKGRLFMWKLKQLRAEREAKLNANNFSADYVWDQMRSLRSQWAASLAVKHQQTFSAETAGLLSQLFADLADKMSGRGKLTMVDVNTTGGFDADLWTALGGKVKAYESCKDLIKIATAKFPLLSVTYKKDAVKFNGSAELINLVKAWDLIPLEAETKAITLYGTMLKAGGRILIAVKHNQVDQQNWETVDVNGKEYRVYQKMNCVEELGQRLMEIGWALEPILETETKVYCAVYLA